MKTIVLTVLFGWLGYYRFYKKQKGLGILYIFTIGLCGIGWAVDVVSAILSYKREQNREKVFRCDIVGMFAYEDGLKKIATNKKDYILNDDELVQKGKKRVYRFGYPSEASLVPEPDNEHDKNAIAVYINGEKIGHVPASYCSQVKLLLNKELTVKAYISGGEYKDIVNDHVYPNFEDLQGRIEVRYK